MRMPLNVPASLKPGLTLAAANFALLAGTGAASLAAWLAGLLIHRISGIALPLLPALLAALAPLALGLWLWLGRRARRDGTPLPGMLLVGLLPQAAAALIALMAALTALAGPRPHPQAVAGATLATLGLLLSAALCAGCVVAAAAARRTDE